MSRGESSSTRMKENNIPPHGSTFQGNHKTFQNTSSSEGNGLSGTLTHEEMINVFNFREKMTKNIGCNVKTQRT